MTDKLALRPAVAFAEGIEGVQFGKIIRRAVAEIGGAKPSQMFLLRIFRRSALRRSRHGMMSEAISALADINMS